MNFTSISELNNLRVRKIIAKGWLEHLDKPDFITALKGMLNVATDTNNEYWMIRIKMVSTDKEELDRMAQFITEYFEYRCNIEQKPDGLYFVGGI